MGFYEGGSVQKVQFLPPPPKKKNRAWLRACLMVSIVGLVPFMNFEINDTSMASIVLEKECVTLHIPDCIYVWKCPLVSCQ